MKNIWLDPLTWIILVVCVAGLVTQASSREDVDWDSASSPEVRKWFHGLMQPDNPSISCCGFSDAYYADSFKVQGDKYIAIITDTRPDAPLGRPHVRPGTEIIVPNNKLKYDDGNPTGHGVIFIRYDDESDGFAVLCYIVPGGV